MMAPCLTGRGVALWLPPWELMALGAKSAENCRHDGVIGLLSVICEPPRRDLEIIPIKSRRQSPVSRDAAL
jgi:hypothetical protein